MSVAVPFDPGSSRLRALADAPCLCIVFISDNLRAPLTRGAAEQILPLILGRPFWCLLSELWGALAEALCVRRVARMKTTAILRGATVEAADVDPGMEGGGCGRASKSEGDEACQVEPVGEMLLGCNGWVEVIEDGSRLGLDVTRTPIGAARRKGGCFFLTCN